MKTKKEKLNDNSCNECNENCSTLKLKYNNIIYWLCDDCYVEHLKESDLGLDMALDYKIDKWGF
jgi:hypothetical protein